jgi:hypothetical protein
VQQLRAARRRSGGRRLRRENKRELERDGLAGEIAVSARPCFRECPANGVAVALFADSGFQPEWHVVRTPADLDFLYARLIGEA